MINYMYTFDGERGPLRGNKSLTGAHFSRSQPLFASNLKGAVFLHASCSIACNIQLVGMRLFSWPICARQERCIDAKLLRIVLRLSFRWSNQFSREFDLIISILLTSYLKPFLVQSISTQILANRYRSRHTSVD